MTIDELLQAYPSEVQELARAACDLVASLLPDATVKVHPGWKNIIFGTGPRMTDMVVAVAPHRTRVNLQFFAIGVPDPEGLLEGTGKAGRHIKVASRERLESAAVRDLLRAVAAARSAPPPERAAPGLAAVAGYRAYASKTVGVPVQALFEAWTDDALRRRWLGDHPVSIRGTTPGKSLRGRWGDMPLDVRFEAKGEAKSSVSIDHRGIASEEDATRVKALWTEALQRLATLQG
jgi:hypothetical protein